MGQIDELIKRTRDNTNNQDNIEKNSEKVELNPQNNSLLTTTTQVISMDIKPQRKFISFPLMLLFFLVFLMLVSGVSSILILKYNFKGSRDKLMEVIRSNADKPEVLSISSTPTPTLPLSSSIQIN